MIRPRAGARVAFDMMMTHMSSANETSEMLKMMYSERQMEIHSRRSMDKFVQYDAHEDERTRRPAGTTGSSASTCDTAAAAPPLEPPVVLLASQGFLAGPNSTGSVVGRMPSSGVLVFPVMINPALFRRLTSSLSYSGT